ncbi:ABC transporter substrate-binding protein [Streptomyces sp. NPDC089919]|uniref:ABC transporter substrate-binding protein n=1 Tax=Streptomyces sp. NPDC089919 TaxID=3155188 RepID=UPI003442612D
MYGTLHHHRRAGRGGRGRTAVTVGALGLALTLAACGGSDGDKSGKGPSGSPSGAAPSVALPRLDGEQLSVAAVWTGPEQANFTKVLKEFEKRTGAKVGFVPAQDPIVTFLGTKIAGGQPPDVALLPQVGALVQAVKQKWAQPLGPEAKAQLEKNYSKGWKDLGTVDGTPYGVYFKAANKSLIWYNSAAFEDAGVPGTPGTWTELMKTAEDLSASGTAPFSVGGADGWTLTDWFENIYLSQAGPEKYDRLARHEIKWTDASVAQALSTLAEVFGRKDFLAGGQSGALATEFPKSVTQTFTGERPAAAMVYEGDFVAANIAETGAKIGTTAKVFRFPAVGDKPPVISGGDVAVALKPSKGAQALLTFLASPDAATVWAGLGGFISPNRAVSPGAYPDEVQRDIAKALIGAGDDFRFDMSDQAPAAFGGTPGAGEWKALQDFLMRPKDVVGTQERLESDATKAWGHRPALAGGGH